MSSVRYDVLSLLNKLRKEFPNKSPYIFGQGFEKSGFKIFDADKETVIPEAMCINSYVLDTLSDGKTVFHIESYMNSSERPSVVSPNVNRTTALLIMLSCVGYSFNMETFPYCNNHAISQMWADMEQMTKGDHVCCTIVAMATRGRSHLGYTKEHATRIKVPPVSVLNIPKFERTHVQPRCPVQPPPPPRAPASSNKSFAKAVDKSAS